VQGFDGCELLQPIRAPAETSSRVLGFVADGDKPGKRRPRGGLYAFDAPPVSVASGSRHGHHIAWSATMEDLGMARACRGRHATVADHRPLLVPLIYFREPSGVLFEIATLGRRFHWTVGISARRQSACVRAPA
jgi:hypothetical protein